MRRTTKAGAAIVGLPLLLAACGGGGTTPTTPAGTASAGGGTSTSAAAGGGGSGGTLVVWADNSANTAKAIEPLCTKWASENGVTCTVKKFDGGQALDDALLKASQAGNDLPDIFEAPHNQLGKYLKAGVVAPVDLGSNKSKFQEIAVKAITANGNTYGVPWAVENVALLTNKDLAPNCPATLDEAVSNAKSLIASGKATAGFGISVQIGDTGDFYHWYPLYSADGGYAFKQAADGSWDTADLGFGKEGSIAAGNRLKQLAADKIIQKTVSYDIARETFGKGKSPYFITGPWQLPEQKTNLGDKLMVCPVPNWEGSQSKSQPFVGVRTFYQTAKAPNAALASTFLNDTAMTTDFMDGMYSVDPRPSAWTESFEKESSDANIKAFGEYGKDGQPMPAIPAMDNVFSDAGLAEAKIASGQDPTTVIKQAAESITKKNAALG